MRILMQYLLYATPVYNYFCSLQQMINRCYITVTMALLLLFLPAFSCAKLISIPCWFKIPLQTKILCYRFYPQPNISLPVVIIKSSAKKPLADPILFIDGGPGQQTFNWDGEKANAMQYWVAISGILREQRDFILFEQRGVGRSKPSLDCPSLQKLAKQYYGKAVASQEGLQLKKQALMQCYQHLKNQGIDLSHYNTQTISEDVVKLVKALKLKQVNLYAVSYGTNITWLLMRQHPKLLRSVILDSPDLPNAQHLTELPQLVNNALLHLFSTCQAQPNCQKIYPHLAKDFFNVYRMLLKKPYLVSARDQQNQRLTFLLDATTFVDAIFNSLYHPDEITQLPTIIHAATARNFDPLLRLIRSPLATSSQISIGMSLSVVCHDHYPFNNFAVIKKELAKNNPGSALLRDNLDRVICPYWQVGKADPKFRELVLVKVPSLILNGQYDPITPPRYGATLARYIVPSYHLVFANISHDVLNNNDCAMRVAYRFYNHPHENPKARCLHQPGQA